MCESWYSGYAEGALYTAPQQTWTKACTTCPLNAQSPLDWQLLCSCNVFGLMTLAVAGHRSQWTEERLKVQALTFEKLEGDPHCELTITLCLG